MPASNTLGKMAIEEIADSKTIQALVNKYKPLMYKLLNNNKAYSEEAKNEAEYALKRAALAMDLNVEPAEQFVFMRNSIDGHLKNFFDKENRRGFTFRKTGFGEAPREIMKKTQVIRGNKILPESDETVFDLLPETREKHIADMPEVYDVQRTISNLPAGNKKRLLEATINPDFQKASEAPGDWSHLDIKAIADYLGVSQPYISKSLRELKDNPPKNFREIYSN